MKPLGNFPKDFHPIVIVTGDRREIPPKSKGDLLAYSVSNTDVMYLSLLCLDDALILSDKQFVIEPEDVLRNRFGSTNILVVGSPAVNLLARRINSQCMFRFSISKETEEELEEQNVFMNKFLQYEFEDDLFIYHQCLEGITDVDTILARFVGLEPNIDSLREKAKRIIPEFKRTKICRDLKMHPRPIRYLMHKLDRPGIFDSLAGSNRGETIPMDKDYGLITVLPNPFSEKKEYNIAYVAGVHGPGTALGLKLLSDKHAFKDHPFGGVYEVKINQFVNFFEKYQNSNVRWETRAYDEQGYRSAHNIHGKSARIFLSSPSDKKDTNQKTFNENLKKILSAIFDSKKIPLEIECPYTLAMSPGHDFWKTILEFASGCQFIIHDMTNCARGVMVEIGFSIGKKKQYFLIWNLGKSPVKSWNEMKAPSLLPTTNIDQIDLKDVSVATTILKEKIVEKALSNVRQFDCSSCEGIPKQESQRTAFAYSQEKLLKQYLHKELKERKAHVIEEEESKKEPRVCKICQVLRVSDLAFIDITDADVNSLIVLGMAKAIGVKTQPLSLEKYGKKEFPWARDIVPFKINFLEKDLETHVSKFMNY